ncbi:phosphotransferase [Micromonospora sp. WMMA1923]|uniref:phosphotransferase n=1 Tax=Micromonospora sp. WMMA1923 TaxID=3404125 RepID=UPI003B94CC6B
MIDVVPACHGDHAEIAASVVGRGGRLFVKAASTDVGIRSLRYELSATRAVGGFAPAVRWSFESAGWLVVGTDHLEGPHPDLSPDSPDLELLAVGLKVLQDTPAPEGTWYDPAARCGFELPAMAGDMLVHSDLNPTNLIVTAGGLRIVDWAYTTKAASWVELALLVPWLIGSGHTPQQAEDWLARFSAWPAAGTEVLDGFAVRNASKWSIRSKRSTEPWIHDLATWSSRWAAHRARQP